MKKTTMSIVLLLTTVLFISCDKNKKLIKSGAENAIKEFVAANSFEAGTWQKGSFSVNSILSIEPIAQFTETDASTVVHFDFQDSYTNGKLVLKFKFQKDINKEWFLIGVEAVSGVGSQSVSDLIRKWSSLNILVQNKNQDANVKMVSSENSTVVGTITLSASSAEENETKVNFTNEDEFLNAFKKVVLTKNLTKISEFVKFPLSIDNDADGELSKKEFIDGGSEIFYYFDNIKNAKSLTSKNDNMYGIEGAGLRFSKNSDGYFKLEGVYGSPDFEW